MCRFLAGARDFSPIQSVKTKFGGRPVSCSVCIGAPTLSRDEVDGA